MPEPIFPVMQFLFPACLSPKQRAILHELANSHGEPHASTEEGTNRRLSIGKPELPIKVWALQQCLFNIPAMLAGRLACLTVQLAAKGTRDGVYSPEVRKLAHSACPALTARCCHVAICL